MKSHFKIILALGIVAFVWPVVAEARSLQEVACEEAKLGRLAHRMATNGSAFNLFLWSVGDDRYRGLVVLPRFEVSRDERQMGYDLVLHRASDLLNPRRPLLPQAVLARTDLLTTFTTTPTGENPRLDLRFELAPEVVNPQDPTQGIAINNQADKPTGSASGAGRALALDDLFERCPGEENSPFDLEVFEILSRTLRASEALLLPIPIGRGLFNYRILLFRDVEPLTYRAKVVIYYTVEGGYSEASFQLRLHMALDAGGKLAPGTIEALPWCRDAAPPCTELIAPETAVLIAPPLFAGHEVQTAEQFWSGAFLNIPVEDSPDNVLSDDVPWPDLLRGTAWDRPIGVP